MKYFDRRLKEINKGLKRKIAKQLLSYTVKILTMPRGTTFEWMNQPVNRFVYAYKSCNFLIDTLCPERKTLKGRWESVKRSIEGKRWHFFAYNPVGAKITGVADRLRNRFPKSRIVNRIWLECLPF